MTPSVIDDAPSENEFLPKGKTTNGTYSRYKTAVLHYDLNNDPIPVSSSEGNYLKLRDGRRIFDATGGPGVSCLGHGNERVADAMVKQLKQLDYCHSMFFSCDSCDDLCRFLVESTNGEMAKAYILCSGSEAIEAALKLARQYFLEVSPSQPQRTRFIGRRGSYHGITLGALSMSGHVARRAGYEPILIPTISHVSPCFPYRFQKHSESASEYVTRLAQELDEEFQRVGPETVCAFVAEPVVGATIGCVPAVEGYFKAMKAVCDKYGALLLLDEVMCGMGRTGTMHAWEQEGVVPDIQTIGKVLGGGFAPIAGLLINHRVIEAFGNGSGCFSHGQTYQSHPVSCAAALEVQQIIREGHLLENVRERGNFLGSVLRLRLGKHPFVGDIRGKGLFWAVEFVRDKATKEPFDVELKLAVRINQKGLELDPGILVYPGRGTVDGKKGDHILLAPAYNVTKEDVYLLVELFEIAIESALAECTHNASMVEYGKNKEENGIWEAWKESAAKRQINGAEKRQASSRAKNSRPDGAEETQSYWCG